VGGSVFPLFFFQVNPVGRQLTFKGTLEEAEERKVDTLLAKARVESHHKLLDIGFGWGGIAIRAAEKYG